MEEPLTIQLNGTIVATTMRTPGNDFELAAGFCHAEGLLGEQVPSSVRYCSEQVSASESQYNVVNVSAPVDAAPTPRLSGTTSSCGWCGSQQIDEMLGRLTPLTPTEMIPPSVLRGVATAVRSRQELFDRTGSVHAAAVFDATGTIGEVREDVGRHNAVDKVIGAALLAGDVPMTGRGLFVSGRASVEMVQKAWAAGFGTVLAVSAPTVLAVEMARRAGIHLVGFLRGDEMNVYSPERL